MSIEFQPIQDLKGIITVLNTPFTENDKLDISSLHKNIRNAISSGVCGFLIPAMASEVDKLTKSEKQILIKETVEACNGESVVIGGTSASSTKEMLQMGEFCIKTGCQGILANIPYTSSKEYKKSASALNALKPIFLMLQDWDAYGYGLPVELINDLFLELETFKCLKIEVVPAGVKYSEVYTKTNGLLHLSGGWAVSQMIEGMERGVHAFMPTGMHKIYCKIYELYTKGDIKTARSLFEELLPVLAFSNQHLDISIHFFKKLLFKQKIYSTRIVRKPILAFDYLHEEESNRLINEVISLTKRITRYESC